MIRKRLTPELQKQVLQCCDIDTDITPPGGWFYYDAEAGGIATPPMQTLSGAVEALVKIRQRHALPCDRDQLRQKIKEYTIIRLFKAGMFNALKCCDEAKKIFVTATVGSCCGR